MGLTGDKDGLGRVDAVDGCEASLVDGEAGSSSGVDEEQRFFQRDVAEGVDEGHFDFAARDLYF